jgi:hypothetical protein
MLCANFVRTRKYAIVVKQHFAQTADRGSVVNYPESTTMLIQSTPKHPDAFITSG